MIITLSQPTRTIRLAAATLVAAIVASACQPAPDTGSAAESSASQDSAKVNYLLVQTAPGVRYADGALVLESVDDMTLYFADRPARSAGWTTTQEVIDQWGSGDDSFAADPPNADLSILSDGESLQIVVVLMNPRLGDGDLTYDVEVLEGEMPAAAGPASLFIDVVGRPLTPVSVAGVSRRTSRRVARRR